MAVLSFEEYKKQLQEGKKPESLYVSKPTVTSGADTESTAAEPVKAAEPAKSGVKTWTKGGSTYVTDRSTGKTTQTFSALDYFLGLGSQGEELREMDRLAEQQAAKEKGVKPSHESLFLDLGQMYRGTVENIGAAYSSAVATLANTAGAIAAGDNNYEPEEDSFIWKLVESAEGKTGYAESNLENAKEGRGAVGRFAMDIGSAGLEMAVDQALNFIVPGSGLAAMGVRSFGRKSEASREAGESVSTQVIKGSIAAATAVATERMSEIGGLKTGKPGYLDRAWDKVSNVMESKTGSKILGRVVTGFGSEALEEVVESIINPIAQRAFGAFGFLGEDEADAFESIGQIAYEGLVGGTLGALGAVGNVEYNGAQESGENAAPNITVEELAKSCEHATNLAIDQHIAKAKAKANEQAEITQPITQAEGTTAGGNPSVSLRSTAPLTQGSQNAQTDLPTVAVTQEVGGRGNPAHTNMARGAVESVTENVQQEAQAQAAETAQEAQRATAGAETPPTTQNAAQTASEELNRQAGTTAREQGAGVQREARGTEGADTVRGFSKNVATDSAMEAELREEKKNNPDLYKRLGNKETLEKAESIFVQGLDYARSELERAIGAAQSGQKLPIEMVPLSRMVANALTRRGELAAASKIISDVGAELTYGGELGQAGAILRNADPITVLNTLQKSLDRINKEAGGIKKNNKSADNQPVSGKELQNAVSDAAKGIQSNEAVKNAVDSAVNESGEIQKIHEEAAKNTAEKLASDMEKEIPADDAAKAIRNAVKSAAISRTKPPKVIDRQTQIINSAKKFALEKLPPRKRSTQRTAVDVLSDYVQNSELFAEAWEKAQSLLRDDTDFAEQTGAMREADNFINEGIEVNAKLRAEGTQSIFRRAIVEEAIKSGESKETIRGQYALGLSVEEISKRISDRLIKRTSADGEIAETIRSAAYDYAEEIINGDKLSTEQRNEALVKRTVRDIGESFRSMAIKGNTEKTSVMEAVGDIVAYDMALDPSTAEHIAVTVYEEYSRLLQESMNREIERRFGDKNPAKAKALKEQIREAINIGAFDSLYAEKAAGSLTEKALKELGITINQAALGNSAERTNIRNAVISLFTKNYGLSTEKAAEIADLVTSQFDNMVGQAADKLLERRFGDKPKTKQEKATEVEKLIEAVNLGAFDTNYAEAAAKKLFGLDKISAKNWTAELTPEEIQQIANTDFSQDGAFEAVQHQIAVRLGREMPATWAEKLREIRKVGMLANPKTQVKNVAGNVPLAGERKIAEKLSGGLQELAVKAGIMSREEQTRTLRVSQESKDIAKSVYENNIDRINRKGNKGELRGLLKDTRTYFNKGLLQKGIEKATGHQLNDAALDYVRRFTYDCLEKGDAPFVKSAFIDSLAQYCEAQGIKTEADVTETAISYAIDQAMAATFKDASALANLLNSIKDNAGIAGQALDVLLPFTTTPINIAKEFGKYSPLGYLQLLNAKGKGTAEVIDIISRATTGSAVVAIGAILRSLGFITGAADDDKDKAAADKAAGISPYSFGGKYSYEWMQPTGSALAMGAEIYDSAKDGGSLIETISNGIISAGDAYLEQSFYKDIIDLFKGYGSPTENMIRELLTGTASQFIPTIVGATARTIDPTVRTSYSGGNIIDDILAQAKVKTPGKSKSAPASVNVRGEEIQRGNLAQRILDNFIFPWTTNRNGGEENAVDEAINEVYADTADKTIFRQVSPYKVDYGGETYKMTGEEREQFQKTQGQVHDDILQQIIDGTLWQEMDNDAKVKTMQLANQYALDAAKRELVESRGDEYSSDWDDTAELSDVGNYLAAKTTLKAAQDSKDYTLLDALVDTVTEQQKAVQEKLNKDFSMLDELIYGKEHGVDAETIYTAKTEADANGNGKISQEELWYYLGLQKNMPTETKSVLWDILTTGKTGYSDYAEKQK